MSAHSETRTSPARERQVWIDGRLVAASAATVPFLDRGAHDGEGLFETLRIYQRRRFAWDRHLERLVVSAAELGFPVAPAPALLARALDEALLLDASGAVLEGAVSNLFAVRRGRIVTPPLALGILPGITRAIVLELCDMLGLEAGEANLDLGDLAGASEIFLTNSLQEVVPVVELDGSPVPTGAIAPRLAAAYRERVAGEIAAQNSPPRPAI